MAEVRSGFIPVKGGRLFFETAGEGHPIVLIHQGLVDRRVWDREFERYARRYQVVRYDVRGFGRSEAGRVPYSDADDLFDVLRFLDLDRVSLIGGSNGGRIALDFAVGHPSMVEALVPVASGLHGYELSQDPEERAAFDQIEQETTAAVELARKVGPDAGIDRMVAIWAPAVPEGVRPRLVAIMRENSRRVFDEDPDLAITPDPPTARQLAHLRVPTLVVEGEVDQPAIHFLSDAIADSIPGALRSTIAGADHFVHLSQPEAFDRAVLEFLE